MVLPMLSPNTCPTFEAGSVLTSRTFFPALASVSAAAHAIEVLPTPPLPVKKRNLGALSRNFMPPPFSATGGLGAGGAGATAIYFGARAAGAGGGCRRGQAKHRCSCRSRDRTCGDGRGHACPLGQLGSIRVAASHHGHAVDQDQRQSLRPGDLKEPLDCLILGEGKRFTGQVVSAYVAALTTNEVHVGRERDQPLVDVLAADSRRATQGRLKYLDNGHGCSFRFERGSFERFNGGADDRGLSVGVHPVSTADLDIGEPRGGERLGELGLGEGAGDAPGQIGRA